jgi:hypothetical protein
MTFFTYSLDPKKGTYQKCERILRLVYYILLWRHDLIPLCIEQFPTNEIIVDKTIFILCKNGYCRLATERETTKWRTLEG